MHVYYSRLPLTHFNSFYADLPSKISAENSCRFCLCLYISESVYTANQRVLHHLIHFILIINKKEARLRLDFFDETLLCLAYEVIMRVL